MSTSLTTSRLAKPNGASPIPKSALAYVSARTKLAAFNAVKNEFSGSKLTKKELADRLQKDAAQVTRMLSAPGNWTLDTAAAYLWAICGGVLGFIVEHPLDKPAKNRVGPEWRADSPNVARFIKRDQGSMPSTANVVTSVTFAPGLSKEISDKTPVFGSST